MPVGGGAREEARRPLPKAEEGRGPLLPGARPAPTAGALPIEALFYCLSYSLYNTQFPHLSCAIA